MHGAVLPPAGGVPHPGGGQGQAGAAARQAGHRGVGGTRRGGLQELCKSLIPLSFTWMVITVKVTVTLGRSVELIIERPNKNSRKEII